MLAPSAPHHRLIVACDEGLAVLGDRDRLTQAFTNLLKNAIKYSPDGGAIEVTAVPHEDGALITIRDEGLGIPEADLERIFQARTRLETGHPRIRGNGLGLQLVRAIVDQHRGRVWAESGGPGRGSTLNVVLTAPPQRST